MEVHRRHLQTGRRPILRVEKQQRNTVARSSEAVLRADDYEHRSTVYLLLASIAARPNGGSSPSPANGSQTHFTGGETAA